MADKITTGYGVGKTVASYEDINALRGEAFDIAPFITVARGENTAKKTFRSILPPKVTNNVSITGCGKLPDPSCLSSYEFKGEINKNRLVDEIANPCDVELLGGLIAEYTGLGAVAWANDEAKNVFNFISSTLIETEVKTTDVKELIEDMIVEAENKYFDELGEVAPDRDLFIVTVNNVVASDLRKKKINCCDAAMVARDPLTNDYDVKSLAKLPKKVSPKDVEIMVYVPNFAFMRTMCSTNGLTHTTLNQTGYAPNTHRFFAKEDYGFDRFHYPATNGDVNPVFIGVKKTGVVTP